MTAPPLSPPEPGGAAPEVRPPVVLLGPQPDGFAQVGAVLRELGVTGQVALITAGWQENEFEDAALRRDLTLPAVNLELHARSEAVFAADPDFAAAHSARQTLMQQIQAFYRIRLEAADDAAKAIAVRHVARELLDEELALSIEVFRFLDREHAERCREVARAHRAAHDPPSRPAVAEHIAQLRERLAECEAVVIGGGHIGSLLSRLNLFDLRALLAERPDRPVVAWSAGAMALTDRVICFHDHPPYGKDVAQVFDVGFGFAPGVVVLPDPRRRVRLTDREGIARFARRMAPARCLALDVGARLHFGGSGPGALPAPELAPPTGQAWHLRPDGRVHYGWRGAGDDDAPLDAADAAAAHSLKDALP